MAEQNPEHIDIARSSLGRCALHPDFFQDFYDTFFESSPEIAKFFANTDMEKQKELLRKGISFMLMFAANHPGGKLAIDRIGEIHDPRHHNVRPELYARWTESLLATIEKYDRRFDENVRAAWHKALQPGLDRFIELYSVSVPG